jgi:elongation factor P
MCELRDIKKKTKTNKRFGSADKVEVAILDDLEPYTYLYTEGDNFVMMHNNTYEQIEVGADIIGEDARKFLIDGMQLKVQNYDGSIIGLVLPVEMEVRVAEEINSLGGAGSPITKIVRLANGIELKTPGHVSVGDTVIVRIEDVAYMSKLK